MFYKYFPCNVDQHEHSKKKFYSVLGTLLLNTSEFNNLMFFISANASPEETPYNPSTHNIVFQGCFWFEGRWPPSYAANK